MNKRYILRTVRKGDRYLVLPLLANSDLAYNFRVKELTAIGASFVTRMYPNTEAAARAAAEDTLYFNTLKQTQRLTTLVHQPIMDTYTVSVSLWGEDEFSIGPSETRTIEVDARSPETAKALAIAQIDAVEGPYYSVIATSMEIMK